MTPTLNLLFELDENLSNLKVPKVVGHADQGRPYELYLNGESDVSERVSGKEIKVFSSYT